MFGLNHILYMVISVVLSAVILVLMHKYLVTREAKIGGLKFFAIITVVIHYSSLWVTYLTEGSVTVGSEMLFAPFPCNVLMWMLLAAAFVQNKDNAAVRMLNEFLFFAGIICGWIGILVNENFGSNPTLTDYKILKGLLSHSTMIIGCVYMLVGGFIKIRVRNLYSITAGLLLFIANGFITNAIFDIAGLPSPNSMYLKEAPFPDMPWINTGMIGVAALLIGFTVTAIYEWIALPPEERWYSLLAKKYKEYKEARSK